MYEHFFNVHDEVIADGGMNWGRLRYLLRYAEELSLSKDEWDRLFEYLRTVHPYYFPSDTSNYIVDVLVQVLSRL